MAHEQETETRIFEAAKDVFVEQGFDGARMATIAQRAGINQSMLHYYFRSKAKLFDAVFEKAAHQAIPPVVALLLTDQPVSDRIETFAIAYLDMITANPHLPAFILQELRRNPEALRRFAGSALEGVFERVGKDIRQAAASGEIRDVDPRHLVAHILGLCIFPFIGRPMLQTAFGADDESFDRFLGERRREVTEFIRHALTP